MQRTIHVHQNNNTILRVAFLLILSFTLAGCALTRVSASSHDKDVDELKVIGLNLDAARQKAIVVALPSDYLFFPMQINSDSVTDHENISAMGALDYVAALAKKTNRTLVIKRHPMCKSRGIDAKIAYLLATNENVLSVDANIHELIEGSSAVIACNSGTSIEALILGKPVYCFGRSEWYEATHKIEVLEDFDAIFLNDKHSTMSAFQEKLIAYLLSEYWIQFDDIESIKKKIKYCISLYESNYGDDFIDNHNNGECYIKSFLNAQREIAILKRKQKKYKKDYELLSFVMRFVLFLPFKATLAMLGRNKNH